MDSRKEAYVYRVSLRQIALVAVLSAAFATAGTFAALQFLVDARAEAIPAAGTDEQNNIEIYRSLSPAVVNITTTAVVESFFGAYPQKGTGSGAIIEVDGQRIVLTNFHVVREAVQSAGRNSSIEVALSDSTSYRARVVGVDPDHDIAVLRVDNLPERAGTVPLGVSANLQVGQKVLAIGNPFGLQSTLTTGIISALERPLRSPSGQQIAGVIQTDAAINPGNSGGPLLNSRGEMIGINTAIFSESGGNVGIGFAVPVDIVRTVVPELLRSGRLARAYIGVGYRELNPRDARYLGLDATTTGLLVTEVQPGSPAARAGVRGLQRNADRYVVGDIIVSADGRPTKELADLSYVLNQKRPGDSVVVEVLRNGRTQRVTVVLSEAQQPRER